MAVMLLRASERAAFKRCVAKWWWGYRMGLVARKPDTGARAFGTGIHLSLAEYYVPGVKRGRDPRETWCEWMDESWNTIKILVAVDDEMEAQYVNDRELGIHMLGHYLEFYQGDPHWDVIQAEARFKCLIPYPDRPEKAIAKHIGTFDVVIRDLNDGHIKMVDHKSTNAISEAITTALCMDDQGSSYIALGTHVMREKGVLKPKEFIKGMEYNFLRKAMKDERPINDRGLRCNKPIKKHYVEAIKAHMTKQGVLIDENMHMKWTLAKLAEVADELGVQVYGDESKLQPAPYFLRHLETRSKAERNRIIRDIGNEAEVMKMVRDGNLPIIKSRQRDCQWCDFFDLCQIDDMMGDVDRQIQMQFKVKDPYFDHRKDAENSKISASNDKRLRSEYGA